MAKLFSENPFSWWGRLTGCLIGYFVAGLAGALAGFVSGYLLEAILFRIQRSIAPGFEPGDQHEIQATFFTTTFSIMGHLARSDGNVTKSEIALAKKVMMQMKLTEDQKVAASRLFNEGKRADFPFEAVLEKLRKECRHQKNLLRMFIEIQIHAACADGAINDEERQMIGRMSGVLGFSKKEYEKLFMMVLSKQGKEAPSDAAIEMPTSVEEAYQVLGLNRYDSDSDVRNAYRRLLSQHHPDKLVAKGLPEEMMRVANDKIQQIKAAYEIIQHEKEEA